MKVEGKARNQEPRTSSKTMEKEKCLIQIQLLKS